MSNQATILVYAPFSFNGQGPAQTCASIVEAFSAAPVTTHVYSGRFRRGDLGRAEVHSGVSSLKTHVPWRLVKDEAIAKLDGDFRRAIESANPANSIAYFWPDPPADLVSLARERGIVSVREMINSACATSGPILDAAYSRLGLPLDHSVSPAKIATESPSSDSTTTASPRTQRSRNPWSRLASDPTRSCSTTFGWTPSTLPPAAVSALEAAETISLRRERQCPQGRSRVA